MESPAAEKVVFACSLPLAAVFLCGVLWARTETDSADTASTIAASRSVMVNADGPRKGESPGRYFNVQGLSGRGDSKFASFGLLDFHIEPGHSTVARTGRKLTLVLTQSIPPFAKSGRLLFFIDSDPHDDLDGLRFVKDSTTALSDASPQAMPCGEATFTIDATGHKDHFELLLPEQHRADVDRVFEEGGRLRIFILPGDADVAATYFGVEQQEMERRPSFLIE